MKKDTIAEIENSVEYMTKRLGSKTRAENFLIDIINRYYDEEYLDEDVLEE